MVADARPQVLLTKQLLRVLLVAVAGALMKSAALLLFLLLLVAVAVAFMNGGADHDRGP